MGCHLGPGNGQQGVWCKRVERPNSCYQKPKQFRDRPAGTPFATSPWPLADAEAVRVRPARRPARTSIVPLAEQAGYEPATSPS